MPEPNVKFFYCSSYDTFDTQRGDSNLTVGGLYFIGDTRSIMRATATNAAVEYGGHVKVVSTLPQSGAAGVLYICNNEGKIYSNSAWVTVFKCTVATSVASGNDNAVSSDAVYTYITTNYVKGTSSGNIPVLDSNGKLSSSVIPTVALNNYVGTVTSVSGLTSLSTAEKGDWAKVYDSSDPNASGTGTYILDGTYSTAANWIQMTDSVQTITVDSSPTSSSSNPVSSGGVYTALADKIDMPASGDSGKILQAGSNGTVAWVTPSALSWEEFPASNG